jgi:superfamily II DNA/RNA helicase
VNRLKNLIHVELDKMSTKPTNDTLTDNTTMQAADEMIHTTTEEVTVYDTFDAMDLPENLLRGIYSYGYDKPSKIQQRAIVPMKNGRDIIAQSQSGTGKTGTFSIGALSCIDPSIKAPQVLVLSPTRELAQQTENVAHSISSYMGIQVHSATGGPPIAEDIRALQRGAQFIVGTPGRIYDLIRRGALKLDAMRVLIMDEADQMLEDRFREQVLCILEFTFPPTTQVALFSATMPPEVTEVAEKFLRNPCRILLPPEEVTLEGIKQYYVELEREEWKFDALMDLYKHLTINQLIIFVNKRQKAEWLAARLSENGFTLECIHGDMDVAERKKRMNDFRKGLVRVLISTDLLARGIDVQQVSMVINYELPMQRENYIHRIGRSGRYGRKGVAINLMLTDEMRTLKEIETYYKTQITILPSDLSNIGN